MEKQRPDSLNIWQTDYKHEERIYIFFDFPGQSASDGGRGLFGNEKYQHL